MMDYSKYDGISDLEKFLKINKSARTPKRKWISYYKIENNKIIYFYSDGTIKTKEYSEKFEKDILEIMRYQLILAKGQYATELKHLNIFFSFSPFIWFSNAAIFTACSMSDGNFLGGILCVPLCTIIFGWTIKNYFISKKHLKDYKKNLLFYENEKDINDFLNSLQEETLMHIDYSLTLNDIENLTYEEVKELLEKSKTYKLSKDENKVK